MIDIALHPLALSSGRKETVIQITDKEKCCGCSACFAACPHGCIQMIKDEEGFAYPLVDTEKCVGCGACDRVCPMLHPKEEKAFEQTGYVVQHKDETVLRESTAGGAFTAIAQYAFTQGGVVFGAALCDDRVVRHICVDREEELRKFRNSKYVQSFIGGGGTRLKTLNLS